MANKVKTKYGETMHRSMVSLPTEYHNKVIASAKREGQSFDKTVRDIIISYYDLSGVLSKMNKKED